MENAFEGKIIVTKDNAKVGMKVQRGRDWMWGNQDYFKGKTSIGKIISVEKHFSLGYFWVVVEWENNNLESYRVGINEFDLVIYEKTITNHL